MTLGAETERKIRSLLEEDRIWCAYALADLEPPHAAHARWSVGERAVGLLYEGLEPPFLFIHGDPAETEAVAAPGAGATLQYALLATHRSRLRPRLKIEREVRMWRMARRADETPAGAESHTERLGPEDVDDVLRLFASHPDRPDTFLPSQLEDGVFHAVRSGKELLAVAGTHVVAPIAGVAAVGNVFTHPGARGRGLSKRVCAAVLRELLDSGLRTIVLNVAMDNAAAIAVYRALGFWPFCGYYEGVGELATR